MGGIKYQFIDMKEKGKSKRELTSVASANGGIVNMVNVNAKDQDAVALFQHIADEDKLEKLAIDSHRRSRLQSFLTRAASGLWSSGRPGRGAGC